MDITPEIQANLMMNYRQLMKGNAMPGYGMTYKNGLNEFGITSRPNMLNLTYRRQF